MNAVARGRVYLVGAGPGDPELLTLKAVRVLQAADVILHDSLVGPAILARVRPGARLIDIGKRCGRHSTTQAEIDAALIAEALAGNTVVRLKGGDPTIFGRAGEELAALRAQGIAVEIVPGITAAAAAAASVGASLTLRQSARAVHFLAGHAAEGGLPPHDLAALAKAGGTLAIYMGKATLADFAVALIEAGLAPDLPAIAIENASLPDERAIAATLSTLAQALLEARVGGPVLVLAGVAMAGVATAGVAMAGVGLSHADREAESFEAAPARGQTIDGATLTR